ncbi:MAG: DNA cytosine methyltransferase [Lachnospiraceae bacterium]|nr:DNA cytosine methyltransferase [Lachnospiraceae bacterium]
MNVLSLCDGMSCGQIAFEKLGIRVDKYYASEIKDIAIKATKHNFPDTIHIGDVTKVSYKDGVLYTEIGNFKTKIDIVIFGSPCQSFSRAMKADRKIGLEDMQRSGLFFECHRVLKEVNPKYFLMENVIMKDEDEQVISNMMGVKPIRINSSLVSAQLRDRYYWTNIPNVTTPVDKGIKLQDVIMGGGYTPDIKAKCLCKNDSHGYYNGCNWKAISRFHRYYYKRFSSMIFPSKEYFDNCLAITQEILNGRKSTAEIYKDYKGNEFDEARYLWKEERARLQTVPEKHVECMTEQEAADLLGDGWTVDVIAHILSGLKGDGDN